MDTGQVGNERIEEQMRQTRARLDRKLDALNARTAAARDQGVWAVSILAGALGAALLVRATRRRLRRRRTPIYFPSFHLSQGTETLTDWTASKGRLISKRGPKPNSSGVKPSG